MLLNYIEVFELPLKFTEQQLYDAFYLKVNNIERSNLNERDKIIYVKQLEDLYNKAKLDLHP